MAGACGREEGTPSGHRLGGMPGRTKIARVPSHSEIPGSQASCKGCLSARNKRERGLLSSQPHLAWPGTCPKGRISGATLHCPGKNLHLTQPIASVH